MNSHTRIAKTSSRYRILLTAIFYLTPLLYLLVWMFVDLFPEHWVHKQSFEIVGGITPLMQILAFFTSMIKGSVLMYGVGILISLFKLYEKGIFFNSASVSCFKKLSAVLIWWVIAGILVTPLTTMILTMNNPPGRHVVQISLQSADLTALIIGGILRIIAGVMEDGQRLQKEMELTV